MQSFARVTSGLFNAQKGLYTTGHNITNVQTPGYTRQRVNFADSSYSVVGFNASGAMKVGLGAKIHSTVQIRDALLDKTYRTAFSKASFHGTKLGVVNEIESILGELYGDARLSKNIDEMWSALQTLTTHPDGIETRAMFIQSAIRFVTKTNEISESLFEYQLNLNNEVIKGVNRINELTTQIHDLNIRISYNEGAGDNANDLRDRRNLLIDELSGYGELHIKEDRFGRVIILMEGKDLVTQSGAKMLGLRLLPDSEGNPTGFPFVEPIFNQGYPKDGKILGVDEGVNFRPLFSNLDNGASQARDNDYGSLKSLMLARGRQPGNYMSSYDDVKHYTIPKFQRELDILVNAMVTMINDYLAPQDRSDPNAPKDLKGDQFIELFSRKHVPRYYTAAFPPPAGRVIGDYIDPADYLDSYGRIGPDDRRFHYTMGNIVINPVVLNNFNALCLSISGYRADTELLQRMLATWKEGTPEHPLPSFRPGERGMTFDSYYKALVTRLGEEGNAAKVHMRAHEFIVNDALSARHSRSSVSLDEEMTEMMKFQHAYDAAAKMVNVIDSMLDVIINRLKT
jgi:flagellar hook-associated protein 1 FlgK